MGILLKSEEMRMMIRCIRLPMRAEKSEMNVKSDWLAELP